MKFKPNHVPRRSKRRQRNVRKNARRRGPRARRLMCEMLEDRRMLSSGGYPELPGLHLVDPRPDQFEGQMIYLDFDGAKSVTYNGPVVVEDIDVPPFEAPGELAGQEGQIIADVVGQLEVTFAGTGITFTTEQPDPNSGCSTIFVGGDDSAFGEYGSFLGLAEQVDVGNSDLADNAFVFTETFMGNQAAGPVAATIAHETGHLLGYEHSFRDDPLLVQGDLSIRDVAAVAADITVNSISDVVAGASVTIPFTVRNTGTTTQTFGVGGEILLGSTLKAGLGTKTTSSLSPGGIYNGSFAYNVPSSWSAGTYTARAAVWTGTPGSSTWLDSHDRNFTVEAQEIDASISVSSISTVVAGNSVTVSYSVTNDGNFSRTFGVGGEIRQGSTVKANLGTQTTSTISPGSSKSGSFSYTTPSSWSGTYTARAVVWSGTPGSSTWLDSYDRNFTVEAQEIDASISVSSISTVVAGNSVTVSYSVTNDGNFSRTFGVGGEIRQGSTVKADLGSQTTSTISPGSSKSGSFSYTTPSSWSGTYTARAVVWSGTPGSSTWLDSHDRNFTVEAQEIDASISVSSISTVVAGNSVTVSYTVTNDGNFSRTFGVGGEIRQGSTVKADLGSQTTSTISPGSSKSGSFSYTTPSSWSGTYTARAVVWSGTPGSSTWLDSYDRNFTVEAALFSLDGRIAYHSYSKYLAVPTAGDTTDGHIFVYEAGSDSLENVTLSLSVVNCMNPHFSPDGSKLVFMGVPASKASDVAYDSDDDYWHRKWANLDVYVYDLAARTLQNLTPNANTADEDPKFSRDGQHIVFKRQGQIWKMNSDGSEPTQLTFGGLEKSGPNFSPDGSQIVYWLGSRKGGDDEAIWLMSADGGSQTEIVQSEGIHDYYPIYRDPGNILYTRGDPDRPDDDKIYNYNTGSGASAALLLNQTGANDSDASPVNATYVTFCSTRSGNGYDVFVGRYDNGTVYTLPAANSPHEDLGPAYSEYTYARTAEMVTPTGGLHLEPGSTSLLTARFWSDGAAWAGASPKVVFQGVTTTEYTGLHDDGTGGDVTAGDGVYSKIVALPSQVGSYSVFASAVSVEGSVSRDIRSDSVNIEIAELPSLSIDDVTQTEGDSGTKSFTFAVSLSETSSQDVTVQYATANDTAIAPGDYTAKSGSVTIPAGQESQPISVLVKGDTTVEPDQTFHVDLSNASGATISDGRGTGTIQNDDEQNLVLSTNSLSVPEGDNRQFTVRLSAQPSSNVTVNINKQSGGDADLSAGPSTLTFTTTNWDEVQPITVSAAQDSDTTDGTATFTASASGLTSLNVTATEQDDDGAIRGMKWHDVDGDGEKDNSEPGLAGWKILVDGQVAATTASDGTYSIIVAPGNRTVAEEQQTGWVVTTPTGGTKTIDIAIGESKTVDFGNFQLGSIAGREFIDQNGNGTYDGGSEAGIGGVTIRLEKNGSLIDSAVAAADGSYAFPDLGPGTYTVTTEASASGWSASTPLTVTHTLQSGQTQTVDFGKFELITVSGRKFEDGDADGVFEPADGDVGLPDWTIQLDLNNDGSVDETTVTDASGAYRFDNIGPGSHIVSEQFQNGWTNSTPESVTISPRSGQSETVDFGNFRPGTLTGHKFFDRNKDGQWRDGEPALAGWTIYVDLDGNGSWDGAAQEPYYDETDANGEYVISGLPPGTYKVREELRSGWEQTFPAAPGAHEVVVESGQTMSNLDFGNAATNPGEIRGTKFNDLDGDGVWDRAALTANLTVVASGLDTTNPVFPSTLGTRYYPRTTINGGFGTVTTLVNLDDSSSTITNPSDLTFSFGGITAPFPVPALILDQVDNGDVTGTAIQKYRPAPGVTDDTFVIANGGKPVVQAKLLEMVVQTIPIVTPTGILESTGHGRFQLTGVPAGADTKLFDELTRLTGGTGVVEFDLSTFSAVNTVPLPDGVELNTIADLTNLDAADEPGLPGWEIYLDLNRDDKWNGETVEPHYAVTDADGNYTITGVPPGTYTVAEASQPGWEQTYPVADGSHVVKLGQVEPVVDQSVDPTSSTVTSYIGQHVDKAQTFTANVAGILSGVDLFIQRVSSSTGDLLFDVRPTEAGVPVESDSAVLASVTIPEEGLPADFAFFSVDLSSFGISVAPGDVLAIALRAAGDSWQEYAWAGHGDSTYPAGHDFYRNPDAGTTTWEQTGSDLIFRTYVEPTGGARLTVAENINFGNRNLAPWQNSDNRMDVDDNEIVTPLDVLTVIYHINQNGGGELPRPTDPSEVEHWYVDVNGDNNCTPLDVLELIAHLNRQAAGEGEAAISDRPLLPVGGIGSFASAGGERIPPFSSGLLSLVLPTATQNPPHQVEPRPVQHAPPTSRDALLSYDFGNEDTTSDSEDLLAVIANGVMGASLDATPFDISISQMVDE